MFPVSRYSGAGVMLTGQVFVSHTADMAGFPARRSYVQAVLDAVGRAGFAPVDMRYFAAREGASAQYCRQRVADCEIYVAVVGFRYGSMVPGEAVSYTELEFSEAGAAGLPRLVFLLGETAELPVGQADADLSMVDGFRQRLRDGGLMARMFSSDAGLELEVFHALTEVAQGRRASLNARAKADQDENASAVCPYPGLLGYEADDAKYFFGRDALIAEVIAKMAASALVVVVGPSGAGKSSLLNAGLRPELEAGALCPPRSPAWPVVAMTPGPEPLRELAVRTCTAAGIGARGVRRDLLAEPRSFDELARQAALRGRADAPPGRMILIVDQFEEVFAEVVSGAEQTAFIEAVCGAADADEPALSVVIGLRADFYRDCLRYQSLRAHLQCDQVIVGPMSDTELRAVISRPAERGGWRLQDGLADVIMADVGGTSEVLPLLNTALEQTWVRRRGRMLTIDGYWDAGGVTGALAKLADALYAELSDSERDALRVLLVRLVGFRDDGKVTAARVAPEGLLDRLPAAGPYRRVLDKMIQRRLVTVDNETVRVMHEALLWHWPHMSNWITANRAWLRVVDRVREDARRWTAPDRRGHLYEGGGLDAAIAETDFTRRRADLPSDVAEFLGASLAARRRGDRRRHAVIAALATTTVLAVVGAGFAVTQWRAATKQQ